MADESLNSNDHNKEPKAISSGVLGNVWKAYRYFLISPIVIGLLFLIFLQIFGDAETLGKFQYFN